MKPNFCPICCFRNTSDSRLKILSLFTIASKDCINFKFGKSAPVPDKKAPGSSSQLIVKNPVMPSIFFLQRFCFIQLYLYCVSFRFEQGADATENYEVGGSPIMLLLYLFFLYHLNCLGRVQHNFQKDLGKENIYCGI